MKPSDCNTYILLKDEIYWDWGDMMKIEFKNGSTIEMIQSTSNKRGKRAEYFKKIDEFFDNLTDDEFDELLVECGIEECPYVDDTDKGFTIICNNCSSKDCHTQAELDYDYEENSYISGYYVYCKNCGSEMYI